MEQVKLDSEEFDEANREVANLMSRLARLLEDTAALAPEGTDVTKHMNMAGYLIQEAPNISPVKIDGIKGPNIVLGPWLTG